VLTIPHRKTYHVTNSPHTLPNRTDPLVGTQQSKTDTRFGTGNVTSNHTTGSLAAVALEVARYKLDLLAVQVVRWGKGGTARAGYYSFFST